ncbi:MAG: adenine phosphoribosyltransferase [Solirubrobacterales bacterium]|nr:adenine phosphoribosyltransferase [Solirubrobacterales bacterium]MCB0859457.1 adenine phosphoribosyltransferase [Solirubrobacterales bacterium]HRV59938.1 adenine phosphoribosyltransferase [Solirubrobacterales bacterium]
MDHASLIRSIPDFPEPGILFRDITPLLLDAGACRAVTRDLAEWARPLEAEYLVAAESRGFIFGGALAQELDIGFIPARKPGKLPAETVSVEYELEYGLDALEVHADALSDGARVLVHDDLIATGGTAQAKIEAVEKLGAEVVGCAFLIELEGLGGRDRIAPHETHALLKLPAGG